MDYTPSNHPLTPPHCAEDKSTLLRLLRSRRVGISTYNRLLEEHGTAAAALGALPQIAHDCGVSDYRICPQSVIDAELRAGRKCGATLVALGEPHYPKALAQIMDAPPLLWMKGDFSILDRPMITISGSDAASSMAKRMTRSVVRDLAAEGFAIVSGLKSGIERTAQEHALATGTVAVLAGGLDGFEEGERGALHKNISQTGLLISEHPMGSRARASQPTSRQLAQRDRIMSGMGICTLILEAPSKCASLAIANCAIEQGRDVLAVPGHPFETRSSGCNMLIRDGAGLMRGARDVMDALASHAPVLEADMAAANAQKDQSDAQQATSPKPEQLPLDIHTHPVSQRRPDQNIAPNQSASLGVLERACALHQRILARLGPTPMSEDQLIRDLGARADHVSSELLSLELEGKVKRRFGGLLALASRR